MRSAKNSFGLQKINKLIHPQKKNRGNLPCVIALFYNICGYHVIRYIFQYLAFYFYQKVESLDLFTLIYILPFPDPFEVKIM